MSCEFIIYLSVDFKCSDILNIGRKWWDSSKEDRTLQSNVYECSWTKRKYWVFEMQACVGWIRTCQSWPEKSPWNNVNWV